MEAIEMSLADQIEALKAERVERIAEHLKWLNANKAQIKALTALRVEQELNAAKRVRDRKIDRALRVKPCKCPHCGKGVNFKILNTQGSEATYTVHCFRCGLTAPGAEVSSEGIGYIEAQDRAAEAWNEYCSNYELL